MYCDGTVYKVVRERIDRQKDWINVSNSQINFIINFIILQPHPIQPSRMAIKRTMSEVLKQGGRQKKLEKKKKGKEEDNCKSLRAGTNAASQEIEAHMRNMRTASSDADFLAQVRRSVNRRQMIDKVNKKKEDNITVGKNYLSLI